MVNKIGRKRRTPDSTIACLIGVPLARERLMKSTKISESLTTIPVNAIIPKTLGQKVLVSKRKINEN